MGLLLAAGAVRGPRDAHCLPTVLLLTHVPAGSGNTAAVHPVPALHTRAEHGHGAGLAACPVCGQCLHGVPEALYRREAAPCTQLCALMLPGLGTAVRLLRAARAALALGGCVPAGPNGSCAVCSVFLLLTLSLQLSHCAYSMCHIPLMSPAVPRLVPVCSAACAGGCNTGTLGFCNPLGWSQGVGNASWGLSPAARPEHCRQQFCT